MHIVDKIYKFAIERIMLYLLFFVVFINFVFVAFDKIAMLLLFV